MSKSLVYQAVLPSGRAVRWKRPDTTTMFQIRGRVIPRLGKLGMKNPNAEEIFTIELLASSIIAVTEPLAFLFAKPAPIKKAEEDDEPTQASDGDGEQELLPDELDDEGEQAEAGLPVDVDAMLKDEHVKKHGGWQPLTYAELKTKDGPRSVAKIFSDYDDFLRLTKLVSPEKRAADGLLGKPQLVSEG